MIFKIDEVSSWNYNASNRCRDTAVSCSTSEMFYICVSSIQRLPDTAAADNGDDLVLFNEAVSVSPVGPNAS